MSKKVGPLIIGILAKQWNQVLFKLDIMILMKDDNCIQLQHSCNKKKLQNFPQLELNWARICVSDNWMQMHGTGCRQSSSWQAEQADTSKRERERERAGESSTRDKRDSPGHHVTLCRCLCSTSTSPRLASLPSRLTQNCGYIHQSLYGIKVTCSCYNGMHDWVHIIS